MRVHMRFPAIGDVVSAALRTARRFPFVLAAAAVATYAAIELEKHPGNDQDYTRLLATATLGFPLPPLALALHLPVAAVAGGALLAGAVSAFGGAIATTVTQQRLPADMLSRVGSFNMVGAFAFGPIAFIAAGPVAAVFGVGTVLGFGAAWAVFGTLAVLAAPAIRNLTWQDSPVPCSQNARAE